MWQDVLCYTKRRKISHRHTYQSAKRTHVELGCWFTRTRIIIVTNIGASLRICPELGGTRVASQLRYRFTTGGELKELAFCRGRAQVTVLIRGKRLGSGTDTT